MLLSRALLRRHTVLPGFDLALGFALLYLSLIVLIPLSAAFLKTFTLTWSEFVEATTTPRVLASYRLTFGASFLAALLNALFGLVTAWVLVRYRFPFRRVVDALGGRVVITLGERGSLIADAAGRSRIAAERLEAHDTTGAGDVFNGFLAAALARGEDLREAVVVATCAAGIAVTRAGARANLPTLAEALAARAARGADAGCS